MDEEREDMREDQGVTPSGSGLRPFGVEPPAASQAEPLVPNAFRPMRSAPHDGSMILLLLDDEVVRSGWFEGGALTEGWFATYQYVEDSESINEPIGWLPMPIDWEAALKSVFDSDALTFLANGVRSGGYPLAEDGAMQSWSDWLIARMRAASGIEAATADETRSGSAVGESPTGEAGDAQPLPDPLSEGTDSNV